MIDPEVVARPARARIAACMRCSSASSRSWSGAERFRRSERDEAPLSDDPAIDRIDRYRAEIPPPIRSRVSARSLAASPHGTDLPARGGGVLPGDGQPADVHGGLDRHEGSRIAARCSTPSEPVEVKLPDGSSLRVRGRIDRDRPGGRERGRTYSQSGTTRPAGRGNTRRSRAVLGRTRRPACPLHDGR